jgi:hypothetical protein
LPDTKVGTFTPALYDEAKKNGRVGQPDAWGRAGDSLWIPRGTVHRFKVTSPLITYQSRWCA